MKILILIIIILIIYIIYIHNKLVKLSLKIKEGSSLIDVYLKKRWDLIPNLVTIVKNYAKHEKNTFNEIIKMRSDYDNLSETDKKVANQTITTKLNNLLILIEKYPELKANENFLHLQQDLKQIEDEIAQARKYYNAIIRNYNNLVEMFPSNIIAKIFKYQSKEMFAIALKEQNEVEVNI